MRPPQGLFANEGFQGLVPQGPALPLLELLDAYGVRAGQYPSRGSIFDTDGCGLLPML